MALLVACRVWVPSLPPDHLVPVGCDNTAVIQSYLGGKAKNKYLAAAVRLLWGVFAVAGCVVSLRYVPSAANSSDVVSRLRRDHCEFLDGHGWEKLVLPDSFFDLDEDSPFLYQGEMPGGSRRPRSGCGHSPSPKVATVTWGQGLQPTVVSHVGTC